MPILSITIIYSDALTISDFASGIPFKLCFLTCPTFLHSGTTGCSRLNMYFPCPSSVSHFPLVFLVVPFSCLDGDSFSGESSKIYVWAYPHTQARAHIYLYHSNAAKLPSLPLPHSHIDIHLTPLGLCTSSPLTPYCVSILGRPSSLHSASDSSCQACLPPGHPSPCSGSDTLPRVCLSCFATPNTGIRTKLFIKGWEEEGELRSIFYLAKTF